jgi:hypothetical protein
MALLRSPRHHTVSSRLHLRLHQGSQARCRRQTTTHPPRPSAETILCSGQAATMRTEAAQTLSPTICRPRVPGTLHPHPVRPHWVTTVEVGHHSTTPHMWVMATSHGPNCVHKPLISPHMARARHTTRRRLPPSRTPHQQHRLLIRANLQVGFSPSKTSLHSHPYHHQNTHHTPALLCLGTRRINTTMAPPGRPR